MAINFQNTQWGKEITLINLRKKIYQNIILHAFPINTISLTKLKMEIT